MSLLAFSHHSGTRLAEVGFLLILFAGVWMAFVEVAGPALVKFRTIVTSLALALAGVLLIVAVHWGHFG